MNSAEILTMIQNHPLTASIMAEKAAQTLEQRQAAVDRIEALQRERSTLIPPLQAEAEELKAELLRLEDARKAVQEKLSTTSAEIFSSKNRISLEIGSQESILIESCDTKITEAIGYFRDMREILLTKSIHRDSGRGKLNIHTMTRETITRTNARSMANAMAYTLAAIQELEKMKLAPLPDFERIDLLKKSIPDTSVMEEFSGSKPLPGINLNQRSFLPSDSETDWKIGKVFEKCKKVLGR